MSARFTLGKRSVYYDDVYQKVYLLHRDLQGRFRSITGAGGWALASHTACKQTLRAGFEHHWRRRLGIGLTYSV
ncbi:hypothetical protein RRG08_012049 [Elysia crispata]|uniref:Uncharacterized protein n=1 Tax=Elysia crispata TaxID=231223 RepID=A0AAE1CNC0_9GAST|nr:hypothetical protein RRG08_012049 [Elysia crispata]